MARMSRESAANSQSLHFGTSDPCFASKYQTIMSTPKSPKPNNESHVPNHVLVVEDAPHVHKALLDGCGVRMYSMASDADREMLVRPGTIAFDVELPWHDLRSLTARLRELLRLEPELILAAKPSDLVRLCEERGVPVQSIPANDRSERSVRVLIFDSTAAEQPTSRSLRSTKSEMRLRVPPSDPAPVRKQG